MLIGFQGNMGAGKTLSQSIFAEYLSKMTGAPLYANYSLQESIPVTKMSQLWDLDFAILCIDEIWINMDARLWKDNVTLTRFINQSRKKRLIVLYTTQHIRQVEMRVRNATDILILCEKKNGGHWLNFVDWQNKQLLRSYFIAQETAEKFYSIYDTYELVFPITMDSNPGAQQPKFQRSFKKASYKALGSSQKYRDD